MRPFALPVLLLFFAALFPVSTGTAGAAAGASAKPAAKQSAKQSAKKAAKPAGGVAREKLSLIALASGAEIRGEILSDKPERVVVDLGFTLLSVPRDAIASVAPLTAGGRATGGVFNGDLFREGGGGGASTVRELSARVAPAVVQVNSPTGLGSGFVIHPDGYVITNDHVVAGETQLSVTIFEGDGKTMRKRVCRRVRIVAASARLDLALLKVEDAPGPLPTVPLGNSETLRQGAQVFAVGSPLGLERSVSAGIVSLRNRDMGDRLLVQTTAQINPGNSGGPLFNLHGEVVGVNDLKIVRLGAEGLGFAIPVDAVKDFLRNRDAYAFDPANPNAGFRYFTPPAPPAAAPQKSASAAPTASAAASAARK
ncbi:MAG: trypsin-like peptidase domain-containing protein [Puniceicoccales bacterium]|jgi:serine protease Do|nr:trypsin-like peptidase domain-containing protein [Puniceicoccales bacterium]